MSSADKQYRLTYFGNMAVVADRLADVEGGPAAHGAVIENMLRVNMQHLGIVADAEYQHRHPAERSYTGSLDAINEAARLVSSVGDTATHHRMYEVFVYDHEGTPVKSAVQYFPASAFNEAA